MIKTVLIAIIVFVTHKSLAFPTNENELNSLPEAQFQNLPSKEKDYLPDSYSFQNHPKKVGLYIGVGTWAFGKAHFKNLLFTAGFSYQTLTAADILSGKLDNRQFSILIMPGGKSWKYLKELGSEGAKKIKNFVAQGGGYLGICAGAYYAVSNRQGPSPIAENYGVGLLQGTAIDGTALKIKPFHGGMMSVNSFIPDFVGTYQILMLGGPAFSFSPQEQQQKNIKILGVINPINYPTMILFNYAKGKVFLMGPHGEIEENKSILGALYRDPDSEWPFLMKILHELESPGLDLK